MPKYTKKPVTIEARQWTGENAVDLLDWIKPEARQQGQTLTIPTLEGDHEASLGDWIIKGVKGEFYPCKPDIFEMTYELADEIETDDEKSMSEDRFCVNCRHYQLERAHDETYAPYEIRVDSHVCRRGDGRRDLVTGKRMGGAKRACGAERTRDGNDRCGPEGRFYEEKTAKNPSKNEEI